MSDAKDVANHRAGMNRVLASTFRKREPWRARWRAWPLRRRTAVICVLAMLVLSLLLATLFRNSIAVWLWPESRSAELRQLAERALQEGRLTADDGSGARELFDAALAVQPDQVAARDGLAQVGRAALAQAASDIGRGRHMQARAGLRLARELEVPRAQIEPLEAALRARDSAHAGIDTLLALADSALAAGHFDGDAGALPLYQQVLAVQPRNQRAVEGREDALSGLLRPAAEALQAGDLATLAGLVQRAKQFDDGHVALPELRAGLSRLQASRLRRLQRLVAGQHHVSASALCAELRTGMGDAALPATCTEDVVAGLLARARVAAGDFDFADSERLLASARGLAPAHPRLAATKRQLSQARREASKLPRPPPGSRRVTHRVALLLAEAASAQARGDWLTPPGESAWDKLRAARALAPDDRAVLRALAGLKPAARQCHADALRDNSLRVAQTCLDVWRQVDPDDADLPAARQRLAQRWIAIGDERLQAGEIESARGALDQARSLDADAPGLEIFTVRLMRAQPERP